MYEVAEMEMNENYIPSMRLYESVFQYILRSKFIENNNNIDFKQEWYMLNSNNSVLIRTAVLLEFYLFCDAVAAGMDEPQLSHQATGVFDNDDRVDKYIVVAQLLEL